MKWKAEKKFASINIREEAEFKPTDGNKHPEA